MKNSRDSRDIRVIRTQTALLISLADLIKTTKLSCITITELCSAANINRNTFYYHYNNIFELLDEHKKMIINNINAIDESGYTHDKDRLIALFSCLKTHPYFLNILISPNCDLDFSNEIFDAAANKATVFITSNDKTFSSRDKYICKFCNAGCNAIITSWILNGMMESPEEMASIIWDASKMSVFSLTKHEDKDRY